MGGYAWQLGDRDALWTDDIGELVEQSSAQQWDASRDVPWQAARDLDDDTERAVAQVMTFIAQNEYAALYVPAGFLPHVNPQLPELLLWLGSHVHDEARHVEVFTKRALAGGQAGYALASTELSLQTLLEERDFTAASLLLNVLGEGTFLDLLRFVERHAPDAATAAAARLAHRDERRHVHFGISHIRRAMHRDPELRAALVGAAEARAAKLVSLSRPVGDPARVAHRHGRGVVAAGRARRGGPTCQGPAEGDGAQPRSPPRGLRLRRRHGAARLGPAHAESDVSAGAGGRRLQLIVGMTKLAPSRTPDGQREVTVLVRV